MNQCPAWLPPLVLFADHCGDWQRYLDALYGFFQQDFVRSKPVFRGETLALKRHPVVQSKEATFWHIISGGPQEAGRVPDLRRCERVRWPRPVIEHADEPVLKVWRNQRGAEARVCLWFEGEEYLVVLARREGYLLFWTAYPVTEPHSKRKLQKEFAASNS
jgi:hypothetical protein